MAHSSLLFYPISPSLSLSSPRALFGVLQKKHLQKDFEKAFAAQPNAVHYQIINGQLFRQMGLDGSKGSKCPYPERCQGIEIPLLKVESYYIIAQSFVVMYILYRNFLFFCCPRMQMFCVLWRNFYKHCAHLLSVTKVFFYC